MILSARLALVVSLWSPLMIVAADRPRFDPHGDLLPDHALARLGTTRFRGTFQGFALAPDGKTLAVSLPQSLRIYDLASGRTLKTIANERGHGTIGLVFAPDGKLLSSIDPNVGITLWDVTTEQQVRQIPIGRDRGAQGVVFSADGRYLTSQVGYNGQPTVQMRVWETATGREAVAVEPLQNYSVRGVLSGDGKLLATWGTYASSNDNPQEQAQRNRTVQLWSIVTGKEVRKFEVPPDLGIASVALSPDGKRLVTCANGLLIMWDAATGKEVRQFAGRRSTQSCSFSPDGKLLVGISSPTTVQLWDVATGKRVGLHGLPAELTLSELSQLVFTPDNRLLACTSTGEAVCVWDVRAEKRLTPTGGHESGLAGLHFSAAGRTLHSIATDGSISEWDVATAKEVKRYRLRSDGEESGTVRYYSDGQRVMTSLISPDGKHVLTGDGGSSVLWELRTGREVCAFVGSTSSYGMAAAFAADSNRVALGGTDRRGQVGGVVAIYDVQTGERLTELKGALDEVMGLALSPDGKTLVAASVSNRGNAVGEVRLWDVTTGKKRWQLPQEEHMVHKVAFSPDGTTVALASQNGEVKLVFAASGEEQRRLGEALAHGTYQVLFSPDGRLLASVGSESDERQAVISVWEVATGTLRQRLEGHRLMVGPLAFSGDGKLATGGQDTTVLLWDLTGRLEQGQPKGPLSEKELASLWASLEALDGRTALAALATLQQRPTDAVRLIGKQVAPVVKRTVEASTVAGLVADLDHARFARRDRARRELEALEGLAEAELRKEFQSKGTLEKRKRIGELLLKLETPLVKPEWVRPLRAVELLEHIGTTEAKKQLERLASGAAEARLTREAKAALARLNNR